MKIQPMFYRNLFKTSLAVALAHLAFGGTQPVQAADSGAPVISRIHGGPTKTLWGANFTEPTEIHGVNFEFDQELIEKAIQVEEYDPVAQLPEAPPSDANSLRVVDRDADGRVVGFIAVSGRVTNGNFDAASGPEAIWVKNDKGISKPATLRSAQPWWIYPFQASPGDRVRVFGRNMHASGPKGFTGLLAIKSKGEKEARIIAPLRSGRHPMYEKEFVLPEDLATGEFEVFFHNGSGAAAGWGGPVPLKLIAKKAPNRATVSVPPPVPGEDSTDVIQKALASAKESGATVVLAPGIYEISETLEIPEGVSIRGSGKEVTTLRPIPGGMKSDFPADGPGVKFEGYSRDWIPHMAGKGYAPLIWVRDESTVSDLRLEQDETSAIGILVAKAPGVARNITLSRIRAVSHASTLSWVPAAAIRTSGDTEFLTVVESHIEGRGAIEINSASNKGLYVARNVLNSVPEGEYNVVFLRGSMASVFEDNQITGGKRAVVFQDARKYGKDDVPEGMRNTSGSISHTMIAGNIFKDTVPRRHNDGETMFESNDHFWVGKPTRVQADGFTLDDGLFNGDLANNFAFVVDGPGLGEFRKIVSNTKETITLETPWTIPPTADSVIKVSSFATRCLWIANTEDHIAGPLMLWGNCVENVVDGHIQREGNGFVLWAPKTNRPMTVAFNDLINSRFIRGGNIRLLGPFVFGNTIRFNEVLDFGYRANYHSVQGWLSEQPDQKATDPSTKAPKSTWPDPEVGLEVIPLPYNAKLDMPYLSTKAPISAWNIIEGNHFVGRGDGIRIPEGSRHFILRGNRIKVGGEPLSVAPGNVVLE